MMRQHVLTMSFLLHFLASIVQEEIDQDGVELALGLGVLALDLAPQ